MIVIILRQNHFLQVEYFDQLRDKYHQVKEKVDIYSRKCSHLEERLRTLNTKPVSKPKLIETRPYKPKKVVGKENSLGVYEDLVDDPTIPKGWSSAVKTMSEAFGDDVKAVVYLFYLFLSLFYTLTKVVYFFIFYYLYIIPRWSTGLLMDATARAGGTPCTTWCTAWTALSRRWR